jgi:hypothetical protein
MITDKELAEYKSLYATLGDLHKRFTGKKHEILLLLAKTAAIRRNALLVLGRSNRQIRHLTSRQRQVTGITYSFHVPLAVEEPEALPETSLPEFKADCRNIREIKQQGLLILALIDDVKKKLLQLDLLELRCRELILSINKALDAFRHESRIIRKKLYPFGVFSFLYRFFRSVFGKPYFTFRDLEDITALGRFTGLVLKIANSPLI